jgi:hypothetical protein
MATVSTEDPQCQRAIQACTVALRRMADSERQIRGADSRRLQPESVLAMTPEG